MGFWCFLRDMFVFDRLFGNHSKNGAPTNHTNNYTTYDSDCDHEHDYEPPRSSGHSHVSWDDMHYASDDDYLDLADDWAHDEDDFEDDY